MAGEAENITAEQIAEAKAAREATIQVGEAIDQMQKSKGWQIFSALLAMRRREIYERGDYTSLEDFKADRKALGIVDHILDDLNGYKSDAKEIIEEMARASVDEPERGVLMLDQMGGVDNREG